MTSQHEILVLTNPIMHPLSEEWLGRVTNAIAEAGLQAPLRRAEGGAVWLDVAELPGGPEEWRLRLREAGKGIGADIWLLETERKPIRLLISDMDSTLIGQECIDELADFVGSKAEVAEITERAMNGELDFAAALEARVALLAGLEESVLARVWEERITLSPGIRELSAAARAAGLRCVVVSGGFDYFTDKVAEALGFQAHYSNRLEVADGRLTGKVVAPIFDKDGKLRVLREECAALSIGEDQVLALGDGANDLPMLQAAGIGVAYRAKPLVREAAAYSLECASLEQVKHILK